MSGSCSLSAPFLRGAIAQNDALDDGTDYKKEPTTLVTFILEDDPDGVLLTVVESGFNEIPADRRAKAFSSNEQGWAMQVVLIGKYLEQVGE